LYFTRIVKINESKTLRCKTHSGLHRVLTPGSGLAAFPRLDFSFLSIFTNCTSPGIVKIHESKTVRCKTHSGLHRVLTPGSGLAAFPRTYWAVIFRLGLQDLSFFADFSRLCRESLTFINEGAEPGFGLAALRRPGTLLFQELQLVITLEP
jgi:hypothetical protein